jgi:hypothetical protein
MTCAALLFSVFTGATYADELTEILRAQEAQRASIQSLYVEYHEGGALMVKPGVLYPLGTVGPPDVDVKLCVAGGQIYYSTTTRFPDISNAAEQALRTNPEYQDTLGVLTKMPPDRLFKLIQRQKTLTESRTWYYDGHHLNEQLPGNLRTKGELPRPIFVVASAADPKRGVLPFPTFLEYAGFGILDPNRKLPDYNIPGMFHGVTPTVRKEQLEPGRREAYIVEIPNKLKLWMDPDLGFAIRRRELFENEKLAMVIESSDFVQVATGLWLPKRIDRFPYLLRGVAADSVGKPSMKITQIASVLEANNASRMQTLQMEPPPGAAVVDRRFASGKEAGDRSGELSYTQPAKSSDLDSVINEALSRSPERNRSKLWSFGMYFAGCTLAIVCVAGVFVATRKRKT